MNLMRHRAPSRAQLSKLSLSPLFKLCASLFTIRNNSNERNERSLGENYFRLKCEPFVTALRRHSRDTAIKSWGFPVFNSDFVFISGFFKLMSY